MGFLLVMKAEVARSLIIMRRYWFRTITGMIIGYTMLLFLVLAFMEKAQTGQTGGMFDNLSDPAKAVNGVLGFIIGMFAFGIVGMFTAGLQEMAQNGQLEQLCMSPHGLVTNFLARSAVSSVTSVLTSSVVVYLIAWSVGGTIHFDPIPTVLLMALSFANLIGFGFMVGGLVLVFKQTGQVAVVIRLALFGLAVAASEKIDQWPTLARWLAHALPITDAAICLKYVLVQGQPSGSVFTQSSFFFLLVSCAMWTSIGIACFRAMENWSRNKGTLGAY